MTSKIVPSQRGKGRVEYLGLTKEIEQNLLAGHTRRAIHTHLTEEGKMTISYQRFCHYVGLYSPHCLPKIVEDNSSPAITGTPAVRTVSAPRVPHLGDGSYSRKQEDFSLDKKVTEEQLDELT